MRASISVAMALLITVLFSFPLVLIESSREQVMLLQAYIALDNSTQSTLAEYQDTLWEEYDILVIDSGYRQDEDAEVLVAERLEEYASYNLGGDLINSLILRDDWLHMTIDDLSIDETLYISDYQGYICYQAIVNAQKRAYGVDYLEELVDWATAAEQIQLQASAVEADKLEVEEGFSQYFSDLERQETEAILGENSDEVEQEEEVALENPLTGLNISFILQYVLGENYDGTQFDSIEAQEFFSQRISARNEGSMSISNQEYSVIDNTLFIQYLLEHMSYYAAETDSDLYELEYILIGEDSNYTNLQGVINQILVLREIDNYLCLLQDSMTVAQVKSISTTLTTIAQVPYMEPILTQAILLGWAYVESVNDVKTLMSGGRVALTKSIDFISSSVEEVFSGLDINTSDSVIEGLSYKEYLMILCYLEGPKQMMLRTLDIMESTTRKSISDGEFYIDDCLVQYEATMRFEDVYNKTYEVDKVAAYY